MLKPYRRVPTETVALLLAVMLHRSGKARGRISDKTLRLVAHRKSLRGAFETELRGWLENYDIWFAPLDRGGWVLVAKSALEGAPSITAANFIRSELALLERESLDPDQLLEEIGFYTLETEE